MRNTSGPVTPPLMLFAAGFGTRMGVLTAGLPKPLLRVAGRALIDHALDVVDAAGVREVVINLHYRGDQLIDHLNGRAVKFSWEREVILETGGGLRAALPLLGGNPVLTLNPDVVWTGPNPLAHLLAHWDPVKNEFFPVMEADLTLSFDHRVLDGGAAGRLLTRIAALLQQPEKL